MIDWSYDAWPSGEPYDWSPASRGTHAEDARDFHVDLGCGKVKKARIGIDRYAAPGVNVVMNLDGGGLFALSPEPGRDAVEVHDDHWTAHHGPERSYDYWSPNSQWMEMHSPVWGILPFADDSIESIITHHCLEHIGEGFIPLMDDIYRVLKPEGVLRAIVPLFPSTSAVEDPDHKRYFMAHPDGPCTFDAFCGTPGDTPENCWLASFSVPYTKARFEKIHQDQTALDRARLWGESDARELRVTLKAIK